MNDEINPNGSDAPEDQTLASFLEHEFECRQSTDAPTRRFCLTLTDDCQRMIGRVPRDVQENPDQIHLIFQDEPPVDLLFVSVTRYFEELGCDLVARNMSPNAGFYVLATLDGFGIVLLGFLDEEARNAFTILST